MSGRRLKNRSPRGFLVNALRADSEGCRYVKWLTDSWGTSVAREERAIGGHHVDISQYYRAMEAFSRQHAKMDGESEIFWLAEAEVLAKLGADAHKLRVMLDPKMKEEKPRVSTGE
jgi:hypothetical protein